ncbi:hypothetical protein [Klenkia brasiliensis]|uniref:hypothetical protein n=1 Tax=Klenkia brasiliensis TaxID=333142 RepID=UPI000B86D3B0|nr:hypothetical protein [Klenkia brasiliensis]
MTQSDRVVPAVRPPARRVLGAAAVWGAVLGGVLGVLTADLAPAADLFYGTLLGAPLGACAGVLCGAAGLAAAALARSGKAPPQAERASFVVVSCGSGLLVCWLALAGAPWSWASATPWVVIAGLVGAGVLGDRVLAHRVAGDVPDRRGPAAPPRSWRRDGRLGRTWWGHGRLGLSCRSAPRPGSR